MWLLICPPKPVMTQIMNSQEVKWARSVFPFHTSRIWINCFTETLKIEWDRINLEIGEVEIWINKSKTWKRVLLHPETIDALSAVPLAERTGRVFPWSHRHSVYNWLTPLKERLGIEFTPHMARHTYASELGDRNSSSKDIVKLSTWTYEPSVSRYTDVDKDRQIEVQSRLPTRGKARGRVAK